MELVMTSLSNFTLKEYPNDESRYWFLFEPDTEQPEMIKDAIPRAVSWICVFPSDEKRKLAIQYLSTKKEFRGNRIGMKLLQKVATIYQERVDTVSLDDMSDGVAPKNLYFKFGFRIQNTSGRWVKWYKTSNIYGPERFIKIDRLVRCNVDLS